MNKYIIQKAGTTPALDGQWTGPAWRDVPELQIDQFHEKSTDHHPDTRAKVVYDEKGLYLIFKVDDRYVRSVHTEPNDNVCRDSCVEFFVEPIQGKGYFNFEINCGGTMLLHVNQPTGETGKFNLTPLETALIEQVKIHHAMPKTVEPEITGPVSWTIEYFIPYSIFENFLEALPTVSGSIWRANFYKCADQTSHPHWASWNRVDGELSFHKPQYFGQIEFAG